MPQDSSRSRTYLTCSNNRYQSLHEVPTDPQTIAEIQAKNERLKRIGAVGSQRRQVPSLLKKIAHSSHLADHITEVATASETSPALRMADVDDDVNKPPESSDDEADVVASDSTENVLPTPISTQASQSKRPLQSTYGNRRSSKRLKTGKDETIPSTMPPGAKSLFQAPDDLAWLSQPSQSSQKRKQGYGSRQKYSAAPVVEARTPEKRGKQKDFAAPDEIPLTPSSRHSGKHGKLALLTQSPSKPLSPPKAFMIPDGLDDIETSKDTSFDGAENPLPKKSRQRRDSDSSLSTVDLLIDYEVDDEMRARLNSFEEDSSKQNNAVELDSHHVLCSVCKATLLKSDITLPLSDLSSLPRAKQQKFCYDHRIRDAKRIWAERGYPEIDFDTLGSSSRLQKHIKSLPSIIQRKKSSRYLISLDNAISEAKGNQKAVERYFNLTALATIHHGYYGPHGAKVISAAISDDTEVARVLNKAVKSDKSFKLAHVGRAVDCVLLPEILVRLVIEDMSLNSGRGSRSQHAEEEARKVLEESVDVGLVLCGDDDHVEGVEEDDV